MSGKFNIYDSLPDPLPMIFESAGTEGGGDGGEGDDGLILEAAVMENAAGHYVRSMGMNVVLVWVEEGDFTYEALASLCGGIADLDGDDELSDEEEDIFNDILEACAEAMSVLGADEDNIQSFIDKEDDEAGALLGAHLAKKLDESTMDSDEIIDDFALGDDDMVLEASFRKKKVMRDGKVKIVRKRVGKVRLSSAQKMALKKARRKAHTGMAKKRRMKSVKKGMARGLYKKK